MEIILIYNKRTYILKMLDSETYKEAYNRLWSIILLNPLNDLEYNNLINASIKLYYVNKYGCSYSSS